MKENVDVREKIIEILDKHKDILNHNDVANHLHVSPSTLTYQLYYSARFDSGMKDSIFNLFKKHGIYNGTEEENTMVFSLTLELNSVMGQILETLNADMSEILADGKITQEERDRELKRLANMKSDVIAKIEKIEKLIRG